MGVAPSEFVDTVSDSALLKKGEPTKFEQMCIDLHSRIGESRRSAIRSKLLASNSDEERFNTLYPFAKEFTINQTTAETEKSEESAIFREIGNQSFRLKKYHLSLAFYTQAVAKAPYSSKYLAFAYSNRAAALLALRLYDACLGDLKRALDGKYPANLRYKLYIRQGQCYSLMQRFEEADASFATAEQLIASSHTLSEVQKQQQRTTIEKYKKTKPEKVEDPCCRTTLAAPPPSLSHKANAELPAASNSVQLKFSASRGRYMVATRDLKPGDVLVVDQPFSAVLCPAFKLSHCSHCLIRCHALLPCPNCAWAMFCSPACLEEAWHKYHKIECPAMQSIQDLNLNTYNSAHLAVRTLAQCGIENCLAFHLNQCKNPIDDDDHKAMRTRGFSRSGKLISSSLEAAYHLFDDAPYLYNYLTARILLATFLLKALNLESHPKAMQIGALLLKLLRSHCINGHDIIERYSAVDADKVCDLPIASGLYPSLGAFNHSCDPNVFRHFHGKTVVLRALTNIAAGEELLDNYGPHYLVESREKRRQHLNSNYAFLCNCIPCSQNWPTLTNLPWKFPIAKMGNVEKQLSNAHRKIASAVTEYLQEKTVSASDVPNLVSYLALLQKHKRKLCQEYYTVQEMLKVSFVSLGNTYTCNDAL